MLKHLVQRLFRFVRPLDIDHHVDLQAIASRAPSERTVLAPVALSTRPECDPRTKKAAHLCE
ncbi:MAG: hypothetical protein ABI216_18335, partial [Devosia sp.]